MNKFTKGRGGRRVRLIIISLAVVALTCPFLHAAKPSPAPKLTAMERAADQLLALPLDSSNVREISNRTITQRDLRVTLETGWFISFLPLELDSGKIYFGGLFVGHGRMEYDPPISMERQQLRRFMKTDSLNRTFEQMMIVLDSGEYRQLLVDSKSAIGLPVDYRPIRRMCLKYLEEQWDRLFTFGALRSLTNPLNSDYLLLLTELTDGGPVLYQHDPYDREQVGLYKREMQVIYRKVWQTLCQYALESDTVKLDFSGRRKSSLDIRHYDMDMLIKRNGEMISEVTTSISWDSLRSRVCYFYLDNEMEVDSVIDAEGRIVPFRRFKESDDYYGLWLLFDNPPEPNSETKLTFHYHGDVAEKELGIFIVVAGSGWYPVADEWPVATIDLKMRTPADYDLIAQGILIDSHSVKDTLFSHWQSRGPTELYSFNLGIFEQEQFSTDYGQVLNVYFCDYLHRPSGIEIQHVVDEYRSSSPPDAWIGNKVKQVVSDLRSSLEYYTQLYGPLDHDTLVVSEYIQDHSTSYPSFILLGLFTWVGSDMWGYERLHRSHEAAHQWFGTGVSAESYRDYWLSEGFAEYSSYLFLQEAGGDDRFLDRLNEHRKDILMERKHAGAVALGPRAYNVKDKGNYSVVVYGRGAFILHMLRNLMVDFETMNEDRFRDLMRDWYTTYKGKKATTREFQTMVEKHMGTDMGWFFRQWVYNNYIPTYKFKQSIAPDSADGFTVTLNISQSEVPADFRMYVPIEIEMKSGEKQYVRLLVDQPEKEFELTFPSKPKKITLNPLMSVLADVKQ
ncbi:MAG: hypothetical protein IPH75_09075 [bacterium]|nr:hypothetical protein [bacterium]